MGLAVAPVFPLNDEDKQHEHCMEWSSNSAHHWCSIFLFSGLSKLESLNLKCCNCITNDDMKPLSGNLHLSVLLFIFSPNDGSKFQAWFSFLLKLYVYSLSLSLQHALCICKLYKYSEFILPFSFAPGDEFFHECILYSGIFWTLKYC